MCVCICLCTLKACRHTHTEYVHDLFSANQCLMYLQPLPQEDLMPATTSIPAHPVVLVTAFVTATTVTAKNIMAALIVSWISVLATAHRRVNKDTVIWLVISIRSYDKMYMANL